MRRRRAAPHQRAEHHAPRDAVRERTRVARWCLLDALTPGDEVGVWAGLDAATKDVLAELAIAHGVEGWVRRRAETVGAPIPAITAAVHAALARHQRSVSDLQLVTDALAAIDRDFLVVKGPALVAQFYAGPELRSSVDLDILVRTHEVAEVLEALERAGCRLLDANWPLLMQQCAHELRVQSPSGGLIDLHWSLRAQPAPGDRSPTAETLIGRSQQIQIAGIPTRTLDWPDTVVHLAAHAANSGADRLIWYCDLRSAMARAPADGERLVAQRATEWGAAPALQLMLIRGGRVMDEPSSAPLLDALGKGASGRAWPRLVRAVDRLSPVGGAPGGPSIGRLVARSARGDASSSWRALASKSLQAALPGRRLTAEQLHSPGDPRSGLYPSGGDAGREAFLSQLTAAG